MNTKLISRRVESIVSGHPTQDGAGVQLTRFITGAGQRRLDPFLMLDAFGSDEPNDYIAGFPDHPHRGFETVTYMLHGRMQHKDSAGHTGILADGGMQWMIAGRGVIHSELPLQTEGRMEGFQLWLNLPAGQKMAEPWYRDFSPADLPVVQVAPGVRVRILAGEFAGTGGAVQRPVTEPLYLDVELAAGCTIDIPIPVGHHAFVLPYRGELSIQETPVARHQLAILQDDPEATGVTLAARTDSRAIVVAGRPLQEPIVQYGPFVMNTQAEIHQAIDDFRNGRF